MSTLNQVEEICSGQQKEPYILQQAADMFKMRPPRESTDFSVDQNLLMGHDQTRGAAEKDQPLPSMAVISESQSSGVSTPYTDHHFAHNSHPSNSREHDSRNHETVSTHQTPEHKPFKCMFCAEEFLDFLKLKMHIRTHTGEKHFTPETCVCGKEFNCQSSHINHMKTHSGEKPHQCATCGKSFSRVADLRRHTRTHTGEKPYSCIYCGKEFPYHSSLTNHVRVHTGEKPYKCMWCGKRFSLSTTLKIHTRVHTGEKPYMCNLCGRNFAHNTGLRLHRRVHAAYLVGPFQDILDHCLPKTGSRPSGGSQEILLGSSHIMFPRSLHIMYIDLGREGLGNTAVDDRGSKIYINVLKCVT
uniref:Zinc finger protein 664 n=1 Tax=Cynoglossus semilaevis TaxID=244447 RepID=A0A3P8V8K8_CYNSE